MNKEIEALKNLYCAGNLQLDYVLSDKHKQDYKIVEQALLELKQIKEANPSEAINYLDAFINEMTDCLKNPKQYAKNYDKEIFYKYKYTFETTIKQALKRLEVLESYLVRWNDLLKIDGINSKSMVLNDIQYLLNKKDE